MFRKVKIVFLLAFFLCIDISVKFFTVHHIPLTWWSNASYPYGGIGVFKNFLGISFSINHIENTGAAWGFFSSYPFALFCVRISILIILGFYLFFLSRRGKNIFPYILIFSGAGGNVLDFLFYGKVIDMFHLNFWGYSYPLFNVADVLICLGIFWLLLFPIFEKKDRVYEN